MGAEGADLGTLVVGRRTLPASGPKWFDFPSTQTESPFHGGVPDSGTHPKTFVAGSESGCMIPP